MRKINVGDAVRISDVEGRVQQMGMRACTVRTWEGAEVIVPNALTSEKVVNWRRSDRLRRIDVAVGLAYETPPEKALEILLGVARAHPRVLYTALTMAADERSGLERLVTELSTRFTGVPVEQIDDEIERGLRLRVEFLDTDRGTLSRFAPDGCDSSASPTTFRARRCPRGSVYRLDVPPADARVRPIRYLEEVNQFRNRPRWYNAFTDNCATAIQRLARSGERRSWWRWKRFVNGYGRLALICALCLALAACSGPVGAARVDPKAVLRDLGRSATTTGEPSLPTRNVLFERGLFEAFDDRPEAAIAELHRVMVASQGDQDLLFALAELSFLHGQAATKPDYSLAAAVYAYAFLFPEDTGGAAPGRFDPRVRIAADLYNWALTAGFISKDASEVVPRGGSFVLPFGRIEVVFDPAELRAGDRELYRLIPVAELDVYGLQMRYRWPGLGAPLAASTRPIDASGTGRDMVAPRLQVPVTALLRIPDARRALVQGRPLTGRLEIHLTWDAESVSIAGEQVPLENQPSAALALTFTGVPIMELETLGLLGRLTGILRERPPLVSTTPYRPGLIPVVFVHGTASSVVRWMEMYNRLAADPEIRSRYQFWFFQYDSGNPIALSALRLREALTAAVARIDPDGRDPALRQMILIGHSQGGLLVKMQVISSGDQLWNAVSRKPLEELELSDPTRDLFRRGLFVEPLPMASRAIFICTPHRGSYVAGRRILANLTRQLLTLPFVLTGVAADVNRNLGAARVGFVPTAVDNMSPGHPFILGLQAIPVVPSVTVNSIIAVEGDGPVEQGNDGVVEYSAAHIEPVESELVVKSSHSTQGNPHTVEEVRRILLLHAGLKTGAVPVKAR